MQPRFVGRVGVADAVSLGNAVVGFLAVLGAFVDPALAARAVLVAFVLDALDGLAARRFGSSQAGYFLDSLADVGSFAIAPPVAVVAVAVEAGVVSPSSPDAATVAAVAVAAAYVAMAVLRLALYTAEDADEHGTVGVPCSLGAIVLLAAVLSGVTAPVLLLAATGLFAYLMVAPVRYPDLRARHVVVPGAVPALAALAPEAFGHLFPRLMLLLGLAYLVLVPVAYPDRGDEERTVPTGGDGSDPGHGGALDGGDVEAAGGAGGPPGRGTPDASTDGGSEGKR